MNENNNYVLPDNATMCCHKNASHHLGDKELDECFLQFGSFLTMFQDKKVNQVNYLLILIENQNLREILLQMTGLESFQELVKEMVLRYPLLCKSKAINTKIKKWKKSVKR